MKKSNLCIALFILLAGIFSFSCERNESYSDTAAAATSEQDGGINYEVSAEEAAYFATSFLNKRRKLKSTLSVKETKDFTVPLQGSKLYVVNFEPNGFVLMSDNIRHIPVLAFSEEGAFGYDSFDQLPIGMKEWMSETVLLNYELETDSTLADENDVTFEWEATLSNLKSATIIDPEECIYTYLGHSQDIFDDCLMTTHWHQDLPYNLNTPICEDTHTPAGCVAVALAQVMNYWGYPSDFNWDILQNTYSFNSTTASALEVARLMKDVGYEVNMNYGCEGSSSSLQKGKNALEDDYGYNSSISYADWNIDVIRNNIRWGYPVVLGGYRTRESILGIYWYSNGHAWVCDGLWEEYDNFKVNCPTVGGTPLISYETRNYRYYLHMNWGWGNFSNEDIWYFSNSLTQPDDGTGRNYQWKKDMITNIHP